MTSSWGPAWRALHQQFLRNCPPQSPSGSPSGITDTPFGQAASGGAHSTRRRRLHRIEAEHRTGPGQRLELFGAALADQPCPLH
jgi:hypothetical protein